MLKKLLKFLGYLRRVINYKKSERYFFYIQAFESGFFKKIGWTDSYNAKFINPVDKNSQPVPMMSYSMIDFFKERLRPEMILFEYGSGNSTLFFSKLVKKVVSVEHNRKWYEALKSKLPENVELIFEKLEYDAEYCRKIRTVNEKFDIIIVDGRDRVNCLKNSYEYLKKDGIIVIDDMYRERYQEVILFLTDKGFKHISFSGLSPGQLLHHKTVVFYRSNNIVGI